MSDDSNASNIQRQLSGQSRRPPPHPRLPFTNDCYEHHSLPRRKKSTKSVISFSQSFPCDFSATDKRCSVSLMFFPASPMVYERDERVKSLERAKPGQERSRKSNTLPLNSSKIHCSSEESVRSRGVIGAVSHNLRTWMRSRSATELDGKGQWCARCASL